MDDSLKKSGKGEYARYEELLLERDEIRKAADQIWMKYLMLFGKLTYDTFELQVECIKLKKTIAYYQNAINHGGGVDPAEFEKYIDAEMAFFNQKLKELYEDKQAADEAEESSFYESQRSKTLYRRLAKLIHPDLNPRTDSSPVLKELWQRIMIAYHSNDIKELSELEVLVRKALNDLGMRGDDIEIPDIAARIEEIEEEIETIRSSEPYTLINIISDEDEKFKKEAELQNSYENFINYREELQNVIVGMIGGGELKFYV